MTGKFRYALEPVLLTRQWDRDATLAALGAANAALVQAQAELERLNQDMASATTDWQRAAQAPAGIAIHKMAILSRYLDDLTRRRETARNAVRAREAERETLSEEVMRRQKAVEAVETHKEEARLRFHRGQLQDLFKEADDHWSQLRKAHQRHD